MYQIIDENENKNQFNANKITPEMLGLNPTTDFAEFANQTIIDEVPEKAKQWKDKGGIGVIEAGQMFAEEFDGTYDNVLTNKMQQDNYLLNHPKALERSQKVQERIENNRKKIEERNKRVNEGTASFLDRTGAFLDRIGNNIAAQQLKSAKEYEVAHKPHNNNPDYRYEVKGFDRTGRAIYNEIDLKSKIGFTEGLVNSIESGAALPLVGGHIKSAAKKNVEKISDKISKGEQITESELYTFNRYRESQYEKQIRGYSIGGNIGENWLPSMLVFGSEMFIGGAALKALGLAGKGQALGSALTGGLTKINKFGKTGEKLAKATGFVTGELTEAGLNSLVGASIAGTAGGEFWASYNERRLNDKIKITDRGTVIFTEAKETPAKAFLKSMQSVYLSFFAESMGGLIGAGLIKPAGKGLKYVVDNPVTEKLASAGAAQFARVLEHCPKLQGFIEKSATLLSKAYEKINNLPVKGKSSEWLKSAVKFDGFLEELGEEVIEDLLNLTLGTYNEERTFENYINTIFKTPDEWAVLAGVIALQGTSLSVAGNLLGDTMQKKGIPAEKIIEVLQNSTEAEKIELNDGLVQDNSISVREITAEERLREKEIKETIEEKLIGAGTDEKKAENIAILTGSFFEKYGTKNEESRRVFDKFIDNLKIKFNIPVENADVSHFQNVQTAGANENEIEAAQKEWKEKGTDSKYFKNWFGDSKVVDKKGRPLVVYHGTNADFEKFEIGDVGYHFGNLEQANERMTDFVDGNPHIMPVYIKMENPLDIVSDVGDWLDVDTVKEYLHEYEILTDEEFKNVNTLSQITSLLQNKGYDGIIYENQFEGKGKSYIVFNSSQIKSVDNRGTFDVNNPNIYYQGGFSKFFDSISRKANVIKTIISGKTIAELSKEFGFFNEFQDELKYAQNYVIADMPKNMKGRNTAGKHIGSAKVIYINFDAIGNDFVQFMGTLAHEAEHARQAAEYRSIKNKENKTEEDLKIIEDYELCNKVNKAKQDYYSENKTIIDKIFDTLSKLNNREKNNYLNNLDKTEIEVYNEYSRKINDYYNDKNEEKAREAGKNARRKTENLIKSGILENAQTSYGSFRERLVGTGTRNGVQYDKRRGFEESGRSDSEEQSEINNNIFFQEADEEKLIAGYAYPDVMNKLSELHELTEDTSLSEAEQKEVWSKIHVLEDAFDASENPEKYPGNKLTDIMLNAYYVMNNQKIPEEYTQADSQNARTFKDLKELHDRKKEEKEAAYRGYFYKDFENKSVITIMSNHNASTALHEFGHLFLDMLTELAKVNTDAKAQLDTVNKWLGYTGGVYTTKQQEKFANNFVAYLYKGKAPNSRLKKVFEDFKEWLKSVYNHILDIPDVDISEEVREMFDNMFGNDEDFAERKQVNELLKKVRSAVRKTRLEKLPERNDKDLDETAKRHKEVCYSILSAATGKSVKYLKSIFETNSTKQAFAKKREAIEMLIEKTGDKITASTGFAHEWAEFFSDTGVSYENNEINGGSELAHQALDVILNKSYGIPNADTELEQRAEYFEKAIDKADKEYKILLRSYKNENRNVALSAMYEWLDDLDEEIRQDYEDRFIYDTGIIERNENVDKFDEAKRKILQKAMELGSRSLDKNEQYQELVKEIIRDLDFLQPADKAKLTTNILEITSLGMLNAKINNILDIAKTMEDVHFRRNLEAKIHKELQGTKNVKKGGRTVGKYDYNRNIFFEKLRELDRLSPEQAVNVIQNFLENGFNLAEEKGLSYYEKLQNMFLEYKAKGKTYADTELMKNLYDEIVKIKLAGKSAKSEIDLQEKLSDEKEVDKLIETVQNKKEANLLTKAYNAAWSNLESAVNLIFNKETKEKYASEILYASTQATAWAWEKKDRLINKIAEIYELPKWNWDKVILQYLNQKFTFPELRKQYDGAGQTVKTRVIDRTLTKMQIINAYIQDKNEVGHQRLVNQFGDETLYAMFDELSVKDVKLAEALMNSVQELYPEIARVYRNKYGLDMPKVSNYFPFTPERGTEVENFNEYLAQSYSFTKSRSKSELIPMDFFNPLQTVFSHIDNSAKFVFMSEKLDEANRLFLNPDLKRVIINKYGESGFKTLQQLLTNVSCRKQQAVYNGIDEIVNSVSNNWLGANIAVKPITGFKQLLSASNYGVDMPSMKWRIGFFNAVINYKETIDYMMKIPYLRARFHGGMSNEALKQTIENSAFAKTKSLKNFLALNIRLGDIGAIIFGGKPYIDYLINEKGLSEEEAIKQFIIATNRSQQSGEMASLSNFQVNASRNPFMRVITAYRNAQQQYVRMCGDALVSAANGDITKGECAKTLFQYAFLQPFIFALASSGAPLTLLLTGDDDDLWKDLGKSILNLGSDSLAIFGDIYKYALDKFIFQRLTDEKYSKQSAEIPMFSDMMREINKVSKEDTSLWDWLSFASFFGCKMTFGVDTSNVVGNMLIGGTSDILDGDIVQGLLRLYGMTEKRAKHITGNEDKKKKKK